MKRISILLSLSLLLFSGMAIGQTWPGDPPMSANISCFMLGTAQIDNGGTITTAPTGSKIALLSPDLTSTIYQVFTVMDGGNFGGLISDMTVDGVVVPFVLVLYANSKFYLMDDTFSSCSSEFSPVQLASEVLNVQARPFNFPGPGCSGTVLVDQVACLLPVEFLSFTARAEEYSVRLEWATVWEEDNDHFTVERSYDGTNFEALAKTEGAGTTIEQQNYTWIDDSPVPGISYYRIKQTDFDGAFAYSDVASVKMDGTLSQTMRLFPNPTENSVRVSIPSVGQSGTAVLRIYNHVGQLVLQENRSTEGQILELNTSTLPGGIYTVHVQQGVRNYSDKLVVK